MATHWTETLPSGIPVSECIADRGKTKWSVRLGECAARTDDKNVVEAPIRRFVAPNPSDLSAVVRYGNRSTPDIRARRSIIIKRRTRTNLLGAGASLAGRLIYISIPSFFTFAFGVRHHEPRRTMAPVRSRRVDAKSFATSVVRHAFVHVYIQKTLKRTRFGLCVTQFYRRTVRPSC